MSDGHQPCFGGNGSWEGSCELKEAVGLGTAVVIVADDEDPSVCAFAAAIRNIGKAQYTDCIVNRTEAPGPRLVLNTFDT